MTRVIAFDLDGTLVDTPSAIVEAFLATFVALGVSPPEEAAIRATIGLPLERAFASLLGSADDDARAADGVRQYQKLFREVILPRAQELVFPGVAAGLSTLKTRGFRLAVATSKHYRSADALLTAASLRQPFELVVGADQVTRPKPHPETIHLIMRKLSATPQQVVVVGDTTHDMLMAKGAGSRCIAVTYGVHDLPTLASSDPTWIVDTFDDVLKCLESNDVQI